MDQVEQNVELTTTQELIPEETSKRITALRFLLAVLVVFVHNHYTVERIAKSVKEGGEKILFQPNTVSIFIQNVISRNIGSAAVPLFFLFAAYLQSKKQYKYSVLLKKKVKGLFIPYCIWIGLYLFYRTFFKLLIHKLTGNALSYYGFYSWSFMDWIHMIFGWAPNYFTPGAAGHFWFIRDLFIFVIFTPLWNLLITKFHFGLLIVSTVLYCFVRKSIWYEDTTALFYYVLGLYWGTYKFDLFNKLNNISWILLLIPFLLVNIFKIEIRLTVYVSCLVILKFSKILITKDRIFSFCEFLSVYSFFLYAVHKPIILDSIRRVWLHFFPMKNGFFCLFEYFGVSILTILVGIFIGIALKKICPPLFALLNGGRK